MNAIQITKSDVMGRVKYLKSLLEKERNKDMIKLYKKQIKTWERAIDRYEMYESEPRIRGNDYNGREDLDKVREIEGWTPYYEGYIKVGYALLLNS